MINYELKFYLVKDSKRVRTMNEERLRFPAVAGPSHLCDG